MESTPRKNLTIRVDADYHRRLRIRLAESGQTLQDYVVSMIDRDLEEWEKRKREEK